MTKKELHRRHKIQNKVGSILKTTGERLPRELLGLAFSNVGKVRRDVLDIVFQEIGRYVQDFADNYTIKIRAELNFERKKDKPRSATKR